MTWERDCRTSWITCSKKSASSDWCRLSLRDAHSLRWHFYPQQHIGRLALCWIGHWQAWTLHTCEIVSKKVVNYICFHTLIQVTTVTEQNHIIAIVYCSRDQNGKFPRSPNNKHRKECLAVVTSSMDRKTQWLSGHLRLIRGVERKTTVPKMTNWSLLRGIPLCLHRISFNGFTYGKHVCP